MVFGSRTRPAEAFPCSGAGTNADEIARGKFRWYIYLKLRDKSYYRPELDVLRFLAFGFVFLTHTLPPFLESGISQTLKDRAPGLYACVYASVNACSFGLNLFFTLSAFLIFELLIRERKATGTVQVKQFYIRRILRIWPLYYLGLMLGVIVAFLPGGNRAEIAVIGWFGVFLSTWIMPLHGWIANPVSPLWSISVEEQFYAFAPWLAKYLGRKSLYSLCVVLILFSNAWLFYLGNMHAPLYRIWHNSFVQFESFAAGIVLCLALHGQLPRITAPLRLVLLSGGWFCWFFACYWLNALFDPNRNPGGWALVGGFGLGALGSVLMLIAFLGVRSSFLPKWAIYLGRISFGLYVYHRFAIEFVSRLFSRNFGSEVITSLFLKACRSILFELVLPLALTILVAMLSYRFYETPFLKMKKRYSVVESQPIAGVD